MIVGNSPATPLPNVVRKRHRVPRRHHGLRGSGGKGHRIRLEDIDRVVAQLRSAEAAYEEARRQRDEAVIKMARVDGLNNREIAARVELTAERVAQILKKGG